MNANVEAIIAKNYLEKELFALAPLPLEEKNFPRGFIMQIQNCSGSGGNSKTKWLNITAQQLKLIEQVLLGVPEQQIKG
jgi:hypothetical protein